MNEEKLEKLKKQTIVVSTGSSMRLSGVNVTNEEVQAIIEKMEKAKTKRKITRK